MAETQVVEALERLVTAAVGLTTTVLGEVSVAGELTLPQWRILVVVTGSDGSRVGEVASKVGISLPAASRLVRRLERRGFVTADRDEGDRRATNVRPTEEGLRLWQEVVGRRRRRLVAALDFLEEPLPAGFGADSSGSRERWRGTADGAGASTAAPLRATCQPSGRRPPELNGCQFRFQPGLQGWHDQPPLGPPPVDQTARLSGPIVPASRRDAASRCSGMPTAPAASATDPPTATKAARTSTCWAVGARGCEPRGYPSLIGVADAGLTRLHVPDRARR